MPFLVLLPGAAHSPGVKPKKTERLTLRMDPELRQRIEQAALRRDRSKNWLALHYIEAGLAAEPKTKPR